MYEFLAAVIVAVITGTFSVVTLLIQKHQSKIINRIDNQTSIMQKEKDLREELRHMEEQRSEIIQRAIMLMLEATTMVITHLDETSEISSDIVKEFSKINESYQTLTKDIEDMNDEYKIVLDASRELKQELERVRNNKKS